MIKLLLKNNIKWYHIKKNMLSKVITEQLEICFATSKIKLVGIQLFEESLNVIAKYCQDYYFDELIIDDSILCINGNQNEIINKLADIFSTSQCFKKLTLGPLNMFQEQNYADFLIKILEADFIEKITLLSRSKYITNDLMQILINNKTIKQINYYQNCAQIQEIILTNQCINCINISHGKFVKSKIWDTMHIFSCDYCYLPYDFLEKLYNQILNGRIIRKINIATCTSDPMTIIMLTNIIESLLKNNYLVKLNVNKKLKIPHELLDNNWSLTKCQINNKSYDHIIKKNTQYKKLLIHLLCTVKKTSYNINIIINNNTKLFVDDKSILPKYLIYKIIRMIDKNKIKL